MSKNEARLLLTLAVAGLMALATGCASSAPATPTPTATPSPETTHGAPAIAFDKLGVDLGAVTRNQEGVQTFLVMNRGDSPLQVEKVSIQVEQGCDAAEIAEEGSAAIQPGEVWFLPIKLGPHRELGPHRLLVNLESNDPERPGATLHVEFTVVEDETTPMSGPRLIVDKETIDAGIVPYDWPLYEQFTLRNHGDAPLILEDTPVVRVEEGC